MKNKQSQSAFVKTSEQNAAGVGEGRRSRRFTLAAKFGALLAIVLVALLAFQIGWSYYVRMQQAQSQMLVRVQDIASEVGSVVRSSSGADDTERADIVRNFLVDMSGNSETGISLVRLDGASGNGQSQTLGSDDTFESLLKVPDDFEQEAIDQLMANGGQSQSNTEESAGGNADAADASASEAATNNASEQSAKAANGAYFRLTTINGIQVFRYVTLLSTEDTSNGTACAVSVWIPANNYLGRVGSDALGDVSLSGLIILAALAVILVVVRRLLTQPVAAMDEAAGAIAAHDFDVCVPSKTRYRDELDELADHLNEMAGELKALYTDLEGQVAERTQALSQANEQLEQQSEQLQRANRELKEDNEYRVKFLSVMSHELRTPLTSILAFLDIWEREQGPRNSEEAKIIKEIRINGKLLLDRVNNILEVSRIDAGRSRMDWEAVDPFDLVARVRATCGPLAENAGLDLQTKADADVPLIWGDSEKLLRILENLTSNAVKYTERGGWVRVNIAYDAPANEALFTVADNGGGIDKESQAHIFEGFVQARGASAHISEGSGLGLAVVRELTRMHGGSVSVQSPSAPKADRDSGRPGTTFTVRIPCGDAENECAMPQDQGRDSIVSATGAVAPDAAAAPEVTVDEHEQQQTRSSKEGER